MIEAVATICVYYCPASLQTREDPYADALLLEAVRPAIQHLRERHVIDGWMFMRFSERGYHLRLNLFGSEASLRDRAIPYLTEQVGAYLARHPEMTPAKTELAPISQVLNRKLGREETDRALPGTIESRIDVALSGGLESDNEPAAVLVANAGLQSALCDRILEFLALRPSMKERKTFVRQLIDDALRIALPAPGERYVFLQRIKESWVDFFELKPDVLQFYQELHQKNAAQFTAFFDRKRTIGDSLSLLPPNIHPVYRASVAMLEQRIPRIVLRAPDGKITKSDANRLVGVYHLLHNRLSLGIEEEVYLSLILSQYTLTKLGDRDIVDIKRRIGGAHDQQHLRHLL
jgi:hypothetical protein